MKRSYLGSLGAVLVAIAVGAIAITQGGCSASPPDTTTVAAQDATPIASFDASAQTTRATGIVKWSFFDDGGTIRHVDGVDANGALVVGLSMSVSTEQVTIDGAQKEMKVATMETSRGGSIRVTEGGTLLSVTPDPIGFTAFQTDVEPLAAAHPELTEFGCGGWVGIALCYAECAACGAAPEVGVTCIACGVCAVHCFL